MANDRDNLETSPNTGTTRRRLLGAATGGFALAASGLFLPAGEDAAAREGALDGATGGRHGQDHRGRGKRKRRDHGDQKDKGQRDHGDQKDKDKGRDEAPKGPFDNVGGLAIEFIFVNNNAVGTDPIGVTCFYWQGGGELASFAKTVRPESGLSFTTPAQEAYLAFDRNLHDVWARNPFWDYPKVKISSKVTLDDIGPKAMEVGHMLSWRHGTYMIDVTRHPDTETHKVFSVLYER